jgi:glutaredoxin-like protein NrdH
MGFMTVEGTKQDHNITLYALSTCGWCRKTKELLDANQVQYEYIDVDQCQGEERAEVSGKVRELNPRGSFPTVQVDGEVVAGFDEDRIRELLEL